MSEKKKKQNNPSDLANALISGLVLQLDYLLDPPKVRYINGSITIDNTDRYQQMHDILNSPRSLVEQIEAKKSKTKI